MGLNYTAVDQPVAVTEKRVSAGVCFVALCDGSLVGTIAVQRPLDDPSCPYFARSNVASAHQFAVAPSHQSRGIGSRLLARAESWAVSNGYSELALDTAEGAQHLVELYRRRGYEHVGFVHWEGKRYRSVLMAKRLPRGEGPGAITADGSAVELYLRLPYRGEVDLIARWIPGRAVLDLGCGVGRLTKHLIDRGYEVTAVDNSPEMLAHVPTQATCVRADIESLDLGARFDAVVLASCLINVPGPGSRAAMLAACFRHLRHGGRLIFERYDPGWLATATEGRLGSIGGVELNIDRLERTAELVEISLRSKVGAQEWVQHFAAAPLGDAQVAECLTAAGFSGPAWIDQRWGHADKMQ